MILFHGKGEYHYKFKSMFSLKDKVTVITGGGSGIGKATALLFAGQGAIVHILDLNEKDGEAGAKEINDTNGIATFHACNVAIQKNVMKVIESIGAIDILVNSAGVSHI